MAKKQRAGINFAFLAKICLLGSIVMACWIFAPAAKCSFKGMDEAEIQTQEELDELENNVEDDSSDVTRVSGTKGFFGRFFGGIGPCYEQNPFNSAEVWKQYTLYGLGGGFVLFLLLAMVQRPKTYAR